MLNKEVNFVKKDSSKFLAFVDGSVLTIESSDADKIVLEANQFFKENMASKELSSYTREIIEYLHIKKVKTQKFQKLENCTVLDKYSPNDILERYDNKKTVGKLVVNLPGFIVVVPENICLSCVLKRLMYREYKIYKYKELWSISPFSIYKDSRGWRLRKIIQRALCNSKITIIRKKNCDVEHVDVISFPDCKLCYAGITHYTGRFELKVRDKRKTINGSRSSSIVETYRNLTCNLKNLGPVIGLEYDNYIDKLKLPVFQSEIGINPLKPGFRFHGGKGYHKYQAMFSAIGEALERYNAQFFDNEYILNGSYNELIKENRNCLNPNNLVLDEKYPVKYDENLSLEWAVAKNIRSFENVLVPSNIVYFVYAPKDLSKEFIPQDTTGLASGMEIEDAVLQGMQEIIERDAYAVYFRGRFTPYRIDISTIEDNTINKMINWLFKKDVQIFLTYLKTDIESYVVHCVTYSKDGEFPIYTHGAGASLNPNIAIARAITECIQLRVSQIKVYKNKELFADDPEYIPYLTWGKGEEIALSSLLNVGTKISLKNMPNLERKSVFEDIETLVNSLHDLGYETYVANLSREDNRMKTVRVIIPGLQPADDTLRLNLDRFRCVSKMLKQPFDERNIFRGEIFS